MFHSKEPTSAMTRRDLLRLSAAGARTLDQTIRANGLTVNWIVGGHGGVISYADFQTAIATP